MVTSLENAPRNVKEAVDSAAEEEEEVVAVVQAVTSVEELATLPGNAPANAKSAVEDTEAVGFFNFCLANEVACYIFSKVAMLTRSRLVLLRE